jgi:uncharacterized protein YbjT (DUF2867 family)
MPNPKIVLAGATGDLGRRIARELARRNADVIGLVRHKSEGGDSQSSIDGVQPVVVDYGDQASLEAVCAGAACVVSTLSGVRDVIVDMQTTLLNAAVRAGVPRFIPSDFAADFTKLPPGRNRNFDLRREFRDRLDAAPIRATSVLNGMFAELLVEGAPFLVPQLRRVLYFGSADQPMDFTTKDNVAEFTAEAALDDTAPRWLRISGDRRSARGLADAATHAYGQPFGLLRGGSVGSLTAAATVLRLLTPGRSTTFPVWQGMQYMRDMYDGRGLLEPLDNDRYSGIVWTSVEHVLPSTSSTSQL